MTEQEINPYPAQVADLITQAFQELGDGLRHTPGTGQREGLIESAKLRIQAAQATATLAHAHETRTLALASLAGLEPVKVDEAGDLPREAYTAAAYGLGLVEETVEDPVDLEDHWREFAGDDDPADADHGDLP